jgi:hypothetical protein
VPPIVEHIPRCDRCGEVIGVYEPAVVVAADGASRETSVAAAPGLVTTAKGRYHRTCFADAGG